MRNTLAFSFILLFVVQACAQTPEENHPLTDQDSTHNITPLNAERTILQTEGKTIQTRFLPPQGFKRISADSNSFTHYLRNLPLKPHNAEVKLYDGSIKPNYDIYEAVVDLKIGKRDLHQCADAIMRLWAEYLWYQKRYNEIHFNFTNGFRVDYSEWMKGKRVVVNGNKTYWKQSARASNTYDDFWKYMEIIFSYAGTLSLSKEMKSVPISDMKIGDVFIQGGSPGHAIIVVDMVKNPTTGEQLFMLAQSYMPAQEIQILKTPYNAKFSPWYAYDENSDIITPEWRFTKDDLKRFTN